jgi:ubiquinone biosynthesis protein UbiJ
MMTASAPPLFALPFLPSPLTALPGVLNHILARETWAKQQLQPHSGKTLKLVLAPFELLLAVTPEGLVRSAEKGAEAHVSIELPLARLGMVLAQGPSAALREVKLSGDAEFAQAVSLVAQNVRWDYEEDLSKLVGDVAARRLTATATAVAREAERSAGRLAENLAEYFLEEDRQLVRPRSILALGDAVRVLRDDLARLEKRIDRLGRS